MKAKKPGKARSPLLLPTPPDKPYDLRERTLILAVRLLEICAKLPISPEGNVVRQQLAKAGTSTGANVEEADGAYSIPDKRKSFIVSRKEAREARYWLRVIQRRWPGLADMSRDIQELTEIINILSSIVSKLG